MAELYISSDAAKQRIGTRALKNALAFVNRQTVPFPEEDLRRFLADSIMEQIAEGQTDAVALRDEALDQLEREKSRLSVTGNSGGEEFASGR